MSASIAALRVAAIAALDRRDGALVLVDERRHVEALIDEAHERAELQPQGLSISGTRTVDGAARIDGEMEGVIGRHVAAGIVCARQASSLASWAATCAKVAASIAGRARSAASPSSRMRARTNSSKRSARHGRHADPPRRGQRQRPFGDEARDGGPDRHRADAEHGGEPPQRHRPAGHEAPIDEPGLIAPRPGRGRVRGPAASRARAPSLVPVVASRSQPCAFPRKLRGD